MDDHEAFHLPSRRKAELTALEQSVARSAQVVFVSSARLREKVVRYASCSPCVLHNGYDELVFGPGNPREPPDDEFARILREHRKMAGYVGSISEWFDWESVCYCADRLRETVDFVLIGPAYEGEVPKVPNIHLLGPRPHQSLPGYLRHFDVALLPFKVNRLTESVNPVKLYEYLSMGKNTVACRYKELVDLGFDVAYYGSKEDMLAAMQAGLATPPSPEVIASRRRSVAAETWSNRGQVVIQHVADLLR